MLVLNNRAFSGIQKYISHVHINRCQLLHTFQKENVYNIQRQNHC